MTNLISRMQPIDPLRPTPAACAADSTLLVPSSPPPPILFLDEPTTGLDPRSRIQLWSVIRELVSHGSTLLLTTQYLEEADQLADDIIVIDHGKEIAHGTSDELKSQVGGERIEVSIQQDASIQDAVLSLMQHASGTIHVDEKTRSLVVPIVGGAATLTAALRSLDSDGIGLTDVGLRRPTLDDVFLALTGHTSDSSDQADPESEGRGA